MPEITPSDEKKKKIQTGEQEKVVRQESGGKKSDIHFNFYIVYFGEKKKRFTPWFLSTLFSWTQTEKNNRHVSNKRPSFSYTREWVPQVLIRNITVHTLLYKICLIIWLIYTPGTTAINKFVRLICILSSIFLSRMGSVCLTHGQKKKWDRRLLLNAISSILIFRFYKKVFHSSDINFSMWEGEYFFRLNDAHFSFAHCKLYLLIRMKSFFKEI